MLAEPPGAGHGRTVDAVHHPRLAQAERFPRRGRGRLGNGLGRRLRGRSFGSSATRAGASDRRPHMDEGRRPGRRRHLRTSWRARDRFDLGGIRGRPASACWLPESEGRAWSIRTWTDHNGLSDSQVMALEEDLEGNLWMGTEGGGAMRLARRGLTSFGEADGMVDARTQAISETTDGRLYTISAIGNRYVNIFDGERFSSVRTYLPPSIEYPGWGWGRSRSRIAKESGGSPPARAWCASLAWPRPWSSPRPSRKLSTVSGRDSSRGRVPPLRGPRRRHMDLGARSYEQLPVPVGARHGPRPTTAASSKGCLWRR